MDEKSQAQEDTCAKNPMVVVVGSEDTSKAAAAVAHRLPGAQVVKVELADREVTLPMPETGQTVVEPAAPTKPETLADNPGKWAKSGCPHCAGSGIAGRVVNSRGSGKNGDPLYCSCARKAFNAHLEEQRRDDPRLRLAAAAAQEAAREAAMDRVFTLQDRAREEINNVRELEKRMALLSEPWPEACGLRPLGEQRRTLETCRGEVEVQIGELRQSVGRCREEVEAENATIATARMRIAALNREIGQIEADIARRERDDLGNLAKQMLALDGKIKLGEESREREQRRIRRKIREAQDRYDKLMDRAAKIGRETGIEVQHAETGLGNSGTPGDGAGLGVDCGTPDGEAPAGGGRGCCKRISRGGAWSVRGWRSAGLARPRRRGDTA